MMEVIRVTRRALGSVTRTGKYIFCLYSFSCEFLVQLCVFVCGHCLAMLGGVECVCCKEVPHIKRKEFEKGDCIALHSGFFISMFRCLGPSDSLFLITTTLSVADPEICKGGSIFLLSRRGFESN